MTPAEEVARARFVLLATFRASGEAVSTPVWIVRDDDRLAILTDLDSGKVRRLARDSTVTLVPCTPGGEPTVATPPVRGRALVVTDPDVVRHVWSLVRRKYVVEHAVIRVLGRFRPSWRRWTGPQAVLRLELDDVDA
ncbi:hypothetical protein GCM10009868_34310 [Terrabacter aerolatus]|uniref:Pyridoxamine 5'-phosphate oxidase N-terminal domain-containing protein n=1 Tax=Terrabacter aerolatus TaxID=422442 RepID=A0A512CWJ7_9MICO|nr:PPOX class F420-dependent oxidoreductase [Terrabacter aerolatus]GEO28584.1 hypothetical protein TAE01_03940 [Terrabacter aerolatus]